MPQPFLYGVYPGGVAGGDSGLLTGPPDDPARVAACLDDLQGEAATFVIRCYDGFHDPGSPFGAKACAPAGYEQYAIAGRRPLELVLQYRSASGNVAGYLDFVRAQIERLHPVLYAVQITEEANFTTGPNVIDGPYPDVLRALTEGVVVAKQLLGALGRPDIKVGFNSTPTFGGDASFWSSLAPSGFQDSLDYVGLDFFPDVFRRVTPDGEPGDLASSIVFVLETMREVWLPSAGIPARVPIHITENGWPTSAGRPAPRQAEVLETVLHTIHNVRDRLGIERYTLFSLRDVAPATPESESNLFLFFGITTADYARKPAFEVFRQRIASSV